MKVFLFALVCILPFGTALAETFIEGPAAVAFYKALSGPEVVYESPFIRSLSLDEINTNGVLKKTTIRCALKKSQITDVSYYKTSCDISNQNIARIAGTGYEGRGDFTALTLSGKSAITLKENLLGWKGDWIRMDGDGREKLSTDVSDPRWPSYGECALFGITIHYDPSSTLIELSDIAGTLQLMCEGG